VLRIVRRSIGQVGTSQLKDRRVPDFKPSPSSKVKRPAVLRAAGPIRVPRCDAPISMGAPSTAIFSPALESKHHHGKPLTRLFMRAISLAKDRKEAVRLATSNSFQAFHAILGANAQPREQNS